MRLHTCTVRCLQFFTETSIRYEAHNIQTPTATHWTQNVIKQGNILINGERNAVLCDFGFSCIRHEVTRTHTMIREGGRLRYLAPELSQSESVILENGTRQNVRVSHHLRAINFMFRISRRDHCWARCKKSSPGVDRKLSRISGFIGWDNYGWSWDSSQGFIGSFGKLHERKALYVA